MALINKNIVITPATSTNAYAVLASGGEYY
jgi:hypothetical protein